MWHAQPAGRTVLLEQDILAKNKPPGGAQPRLVREPADRRLQPHVLARLGQDHALGAHHRAAPRPRRVSVIEGDQETLRDAERIRGTGARAVQINTGSGCHLDARMVADALRALDPPRGSLLFIENVGNLVCPALFDLGEGPKVVIASVTEARTSR